MLDAETTIVGLNRIYEVQPASSNTSDIYNAGTYYNAAGYNYQKQMPRLLGSGVNELLKMYVGHFGSVTLDEAALRLGLAMSDGFAPNYDTDFDHQNAVIVIRINGTEIYNGNLVDNLIVTEKDGAGNPTPVPGYVSVARAYFQLSIADPIALLNQAGENTINIAMTGNATPLALIELQIGVFY